ncbi:MAG: HAMP domain-containing histidine kinase [Saccharothrix sp.]|nr:HAMP domain-containing histidine kinase [Saccharothrix sp.]
MRLGTRLGLAFAAVMVVAMGVIGWGLLTASTGAALERVDERLHRVAEVTSLRGGHGVRLPNWDGVPIVLVVPTSTGWQPKLQALADALPPLPALPPVDSAEFAALGSAAHTLAAEDGTRWRVVTLTGSAVIAPLTEVDRARDTLLAGIVVIGGLGVVAAVAAARLLVNRSLAPVRHMVTTAAAVADGDLTRRVDRRGDPTELGVLGRALDHMIDRLAADAEQRAATTELLRRFVADASHELRTPVTVIRGYAELFAAGGARAPEALARAMTRIGSESTRLGDLVDDLVLLTRLDQRAVDRTEVVDLAAVVDEAVAAGEVLRHGIGWAGSPRVAVRGDAVRLRQVVDNLLTNAGRHTPPGTRVEVGLSTSGGRAVLTVADAGPGIPFAERERVFERFHRLDPSRSRAHGGSGLGLAITRSIVESHGGRVFVRDAALGGAEFVVELPR